MAKVRVNSLYVYNPVGVDIWDPPYNVKPGDVVRVVNKYGCPKANTMGMCYVNHLDGTFGGMVLTNSLTRYVKGKVTRPSYLDAPITDADVIG